MEKYIQSILTGLKELQAKKEILSQEQIHDLGELLCKFDEELGNFLLELD